jgi:hypothetical protein
VTLQQSQVNSRDIYDSNLMRPIFFIKQIKTL